MKNLFTSIAVIILAMHSAAQCPFSLSSAGCPLSIQLSDTGDHCGLNNGSVTAHVSGGSGSYAYQWSNGGGSSAITNLVAGLYAVSVTDLSLCRVIDGSGNCTGYSYATASAIITTSAGLSLNLLPTNVNCDGDSGAITTTLAGGTAPYTYAWTGSNGYSSSNQNITNIDTGTYRLIVTDAYGCIDSATTLVNAVNCPSWIGFYTRPENNPEIAGVHVLEENHISDTSISPVKICADGSNATTVKYLNKDASIVTRNVRFCVGSDPGGSNTDYAGWFDGYSYNGDTVIVKYTAPEYLDVPGLYRDDFIHVVNSANGSVMYQHPIQIYRAPVLLIHGLWGNFLSLFSIGSMLALSGKYDPYMIRCVNYESTNSAGFAQNANVIKNEINAMFHRLRGLNFSVGKVDIVAHSMGGLLARIYLQNNACNGGATINCYRNDIHKLITLNTPHSGTQMANFLLSEDSSLAEFFGFFIPWDKGAVSDLQCNSIQIGSLNGTTLNKHIVPSYAIVTDKTPHETLNLFGAAIEEVLVTAAAASRGESASTFANIIFASTPSDLIVPITSQQGGLINYKSFDSITHTQSPNSDSVAAEVKSLLDANPANSNYFSSSGFNPPVIIPTFKREETDSVPKGGPRSGTVNITSPHWGFSCSENQVVPVSVSASTNITRLIMLAGNSDIGITSFDTPAHSVTVNYTVPNNAIGTIKLMAIGYDATGFVNLDTLEISVTPTAVLDSIAFVNGYISVPVGQSASWGLLGYYHNSTVRNLGLANNVSYNMSASNIASLNGNIINGLSMGTSVLHAFYLGNDAYIPVNVYDGDNWVVNDSLSSGINGPDPHKAMPRISLFPNPNSGAFTILSDIKQTGTIDICSITGEKVFSQTAPSLANATIDMPHQAKGMYLIKLSNAEGVWVQWVVIK